MDIIELAQPEWPSHILTYFHRLEEVRNTSLLRGLPKVERNEDPGFAPETSHRLKNQFDWRCNNIFDLRR